MAAQRHDGRGRREPSEATRAGRARWNAPEPKGPKVERVSARRQPMPVDENEEAAFATVGERRPAKGRTTATGVEAAQTRMRGAIDEADPPARGFADAEDDTGDEGVDAPPMAPAPRGVRVGPPAAERVAASASGTSEAFSPFAPPIAHADEATIGRIASRVHPALNARHVDPTDIDRLWDWLRETPDEYFLNRTFATTMELHNTFHSLRVAEQSRLSILRALDWGTEHFGFVMLSPILTDVRTALLHVYLRPDARQSVGQLAHGLMEIVDQLVSHVRIAVLSPDDRFADALLRMKFQKHVMYVR